METFVAFTVELEKTRRQSEVVLKTLKVFKTFGVLQIRTPHMWKKPEQRGPSRPSFFNPKT